MEQPESFLTGFQSLPGKTGYLRFSSMGPKVVLVYRRTSRFPSHPFSTCRFFLSPYCLCNRLCIRLSNYGVSLRHILSNGFSLQKDGQRAPCRRHGSKARKINSTEIPTRGKSWRGYHTVYLPLRQDIYLMWSRKGNDPSKA